MRKQPAKKRPKQQPKQKVTDICDTCRHGTWNTAFENLDIHGKPITLRCPFYRDGAIGIIRGSSACNNYQTK